MNNKRGWRDWLLGLENAILYAIVAWIIKRRGVAFVWWVAPDEFEAMALDDEAWLCDVYD